MTLHEAIEKLLQQTGRPMTAREIANELNKNKWYVKGDKSLIKTSQITARVDDHHELFEIDRSISPLKIKLFGRQFTPTAKLVSAKIEIPKQVMKATQISSAEISLFEKILMNEKNFKSASIIDNLIPNVSGVYCIRITDVNKLPKPFNTFLADRQHNIIYIGIASKSLNRRFLNQELRAKGHGTFFRSIGAVLGHRPPKGSLSLKNNKRNYKFSTTDEQKIIYWINENLKVNWVKFSGDFETIETELINKHRPLINLAKNPSALLLLSEFRKECVQIANEL
ncbi:MAG: HTH domain-containing protein [Chitinophagales bacterium]|nr:winged helix-turn-helix domain-containing protein [Bacteroidota bacterium]MBK8487825.1 winged helix-turn-helix domain-containing protein [Bacteroidota bacterium]MBK8682420.1 winged helix-turn-helix domain-containing protein [Bacteroidota bacterium]